MSNQLQIRFPWSRPRVAVLEISGAIGAQVRGLQMSRTIRALEKDPRVKAVVLEIDSPGGSASASDMIFKQLQKLSKKKPTVAYIGGSGLSGGYLIASAARHIIAGETALVGSIGVIFMRPVVQELMAKLGVRMEMTHEGHLKGMFQPWREPTEEERTKVQGLTDELYEWFVGAVAAARNLDIKKVREFATGEMFSGRKALEIGLIDEIGDFDLALKTARRMADLSERPRLQWVRPRRPLLERVMARGSFSAGEIAAEIEARIVPRIEFR
ncbi:MAG TPA: signal peptide peptidase SppA [Dehalococcoidia bacterium]|nr:signal peptide peptidase SppA [Dehalococcoidia bacterium]